MTRRQETISKGAARGGAAREGAAGKSMASRRGGTGGERRADAALGVLGGTLAAASAAFGVTMALHGPVAELGHSGDFTIFAQLAPHSRPARTPDAASGINDLDVTSTASIPRRRPMSGDAAALVTLRSADAGTATVVVDGVSRVVRVGDTIPGVGAVLAIVPGLRPMLRTSGGLIGAAREP